MGKNLQAKELILKAGSTIKSCMFSLREKEFHSVSNIFSLNNSETEVEYLRKAASVVRRCQRHGFDGNELDILLEVLSLCPQEKIDLFFISKVAGAIKKAKDEKHEDLWIDFLFDVLALAREDMDLSYLTKVHNISKTNECPENLKDSVGSNQFKSKRALFDALEKFVLLDKSSTVVVWGFWYGSLIVPYLRDKVGMIYGIDKDDEVIRFAKNTLFGDLDNVDYITDDIFRIYRGFYSKTNLLINTSCEHMKPMKEWPWFREDPSGSANFGSDCYFAFQSNNMFNIEGHVNCVNSIEEFIDQLPDRAELLHQQEIVEERGTRYMLVGKLT